MTTAARPTNRPVRHRSRRAFRPLPQMRRMGNQTISPSKANGNRKNKTKSPAEMMNDSMATTGPVRKMTAKPTRAKKAIFRKRSILLEPMGDAWELVTLAAKAGTTCLIISYSSGIPNYLLQIKGGLRRCARTVFSMRRAQKRCYNRGMNRLREDSWAPLAMFLLGEDCT